MLFKHQCLHSARVPIRLGSTSGETHYMSHWPHSNTGLTRAALESRRCSKKIFMANRVKESSRRQWELIFLANWTRGLTRGAWESRCCHQQNSCQPGVKHKAKRGFCANCHCWHFSVRPSSWAEHNVSSLYGSPSRRAWSWQYLSGD